MPEISSSLGPPVTHADMEKNKQKSHKRAADFLSDGEGDGTLALGKTSENKKAKKTGKKEKMEEKENAAAKAPEEGEKVKKPPMKKGKSKSVKAAESAEKLLSTPVSEWPKKGSKKKALQASKENQTLAADGANGVVEASANKEVETIDKRDAVNTSMQAEAQRTVDEELEDEWGSDDDQPDDQGAALLTNFDSDSEDDAEDTDLKKDKSMPPLHRNAQKALQKLSKKIATKSQTPASEPGTVYVGRVPHGFYEREMREYFSQFGTITKLRLSRNKRTGASKHFAFIQFEDKEVAQIVANTMDNYLMFGHILKCKFAPEESLHKDVWKGANKRYRKIPHQKLEKQKLEAPKTTKQWSKKVKQEQKKREKQAALLKETMGYEIELPRMSDPEEVLEKRKLAEAEAQGQKKLAAEGDEADASAGDDKPSKELPKGEVAVKAFKKKSEKSKKAAGDEFDVLGRGDKQRAEDENVVKASKKESKKSKKAVSDNIGASADAVKPPKALSQDEATAKAGKKKTKKTTSADEEGVSKKKRKSASEPELKGILKKSKKA